MSKPILFNTIKRAKFNTLTEEQKKKNWVIKEVDGTVTTHIGSIDVEGGSTVTVDSEMSDSSTNPVQNKVITETLAGKQDDLTFDSKPTAGSYNPVTSSGIKEYIDAHSTTIIECSTNEQTGGIESTATYAEILEAATQGNVMFKVLFGEQVIGTVALIAAVQSGENVIEVVIGTQTSPYVVYTSGAPNNTFAMGT